MLITNQCAAWNFCFISSVISFFLTTSLGFYTARIQGENIYEDATRETVKLSSKEEFIHPSEHMWE